MDLLQKIRKTIETYSMLEKGDGVVVAVSGGVDSTVLLHLLLELTGPYNLSLYVAHINHSLRGEESDRDEAFVRDMAGRFNLPFFSRKVKREELMEKGLSLQASARKVRYEFLFHVMRRCGAERIALGHNRDDQVETVIMRFLMGSGLRGLGGMDPVRGAIIRPLFESTREEILAYAKERGIGYVVDRTNLEPKYMRNRVRLELIPFLKRGFNPGIGETIFRLSRVLKRDEEVLEKEEEGAFKRALLKEEKGSITLSIPSLLTMPEGMRARVMKRAWEILTSRRAGLYACHVDALLRVLSSPSPNLTLNLPLSVRAEKAYDTLAFTRAPFPPVAYSYPLQVPGITEIPEAGLYVRADIVDRVDMGEIRARRDVAVFDYDALKGPFMVRSFEPGDRIRPFGMVGSKKVKDLFIDLKISIRQRRVIPLLVSSDGILWVLGVRRSSLAPVREDTKRILRVEAVEL